jgi:hypothetical protein
MGLDMYLFKTKRLEDFDLYKCWPEDLKEENPEMFEKTKQYLIDRGDSNYSWQDYHEEAGYWRKANAIHAWFVKNVQNGVDDCGNYEVTEDKVKELLSLCEDVMKNQKKAHKILPTQSGFFFGSYDYDEWYFVEIKYTIKILKKLKKFDYKNYVLSYHSSW